MKRERDHSNGGLNPQAEDPEDGDGASHKQGALNRLRVLEAGRSQLKQPIRITDRLNCPSELDLPAINSAIRQGTRQRQNCGKRHGPGEPVKDVTPRRGERDSCCVAQLSPEWESLCECRSAAVPKPETRFVTRPRERHNSHPRQIALELKLLIAKPLSPRPSLSARLPASAGSSVARLRLRRSPLPAVSWSRHGRHQQQRHLASTSVGSHRSR